jgi:crotonobetainyl-CoA:carnitine CoA-transferase CaiB-like acyl-CoA transferase
MENALEGLRVLDLTRALAGPYGSLLMGDLGAEIIKIEAIGSRKEATGKYSYKGQDAYFMSVNRSKKSLTLDVRKDKGREIFYDLVKISDVVYDNFRSGVLERLKIDYNTLKEINPKIICCSITGYGSKGPYRLLPAYDLVIQAASGSMSITGEEGGPPVRSGIAIADQGAGMFAVHGILAALYKRERTGVGSKVETSLLENMIALLAYEAGYYFASGEVPGRVGAGHRTLALYDCFETQDDYITIAAVFKFPDLCRALDREELINDPRFSDDHIEEHKADLLPILKEIFLTKTTEEWLEVLNEADIPCSPLNKLDQALNDPQVLANDMVVSVEHTLGGEVKQTGNPIKISTTPPELRKKFLSPPTLGEHNNEVLSQLLGYPQERIEKLKEEQVI